ncbi:MAG: AAA family ATPase [Planctomycetes bacterium]|nr:AAA family ATPase [Planctomycetota bacterium]
MGKNLKKIASLKGCGAFVDFKWDDTVGANVCLKRRNIFFGWNGSGKTTMSRIFRVVENWQSDKPVANILPAGWDVKLQVEGDNAFKLKQDKIDKLPPVFVFNRDFVQESVVGTPGPLSPIVTLGKDSADDAAKLKRLEEERAEVERKDTATIQKQADEKRDWDSMCSAGAKDIKTKLGERGVTEFRNFERDHFKARLEPFAKEPSKFAAARLTEQELTRQLATVSAEERQPVSRLPMSTDDLAATLGTVAEVCGRSVVVAAIQSLENTPDVEAWIRNGLTLHQKHAAKDCFYCGQELPEGRTFALEKHFDAAYDQLLTDIDTASAKLKAAKNADDDLSRVVPAPDAILAPLRDEYTTASAKLNKQIATRVKIIDQATEHLATRQKQPLKNFMLTVPSVSSLEIEAVNGLIDKHNQGVSDHRKLVKDASDKVADHVLSEYEEAWVAHVAASKAHVKEREKLTIQGDGLDDQIAELRKLVEGHDKTATELNSDLKDYLGHDDLTLAAVPEGYKLLRRGDVAKAESLSEGEKTALAVLYFLRRLDPNAKGVDRTNSLIVVDDPISSLDSNALYAAITFVCHRLEDAGQVILMTHSFTAFREWKKWCKTRALEGGGASFQCRSITVDGQRCSTIGAVDQLLENYESEYHYLFHYVVKASEAPLAAHELLPLANVARRVLEAFLAFRRPRPSEGEGIGHGKRSMDLDLVQFKPKLPDVSLSQLSRLERFVNTFSHNDSVTVPGSERTPTGESDQVAGILLAFMAGLDPDHVAEMKSLIAPLPTTAAQGAP